MSEQDETQRVVVRDRRRVDPSGKVRSVEPERSVEPAPDAHAEEVAAEEFVEVRRLQAELDERTADLQRVKAEFDNYRRRVERDRLVVAEQAVGGILAHLLPMLDDIDRAREHEELTGGFRSVAEALTATLAKLGLARFGDVGDPFDPTRHEAVLHRHSPDVAEPTCVEVLRSGYLLGDRLLRPAMVAVAEPVVAEPVETLIVPAE